jgi:putative redox protein
MNYVSNILWRKDLDFTADLYNYSIDLSGSPQESGSSCSPKLLMLVALGGCTGMDVISILQKMKVDVNFFNLKIQGVTNDEHPKKFTSMKVIYELKGNNIELEKVQKAVDLSKERYCGVMATYKEAMDLEFEIKILP